MKNTRHKLEKDIPYDVLRRADRTVHVPFLITMTDCDEKIYCEEVVRVVSGKRLVAFGTWNDKAIVAKLFYEPGNARRHVDREIKGIEAFLSARVPTPKLLFQGVSQKNNIHVLIFERILGAAGLGDMWDRKNFPEELTELMRTATVELATQHVLGLVQRDLHLNNFLVKGKKIYTLDGGSVDQLDILLSKEQSLDHLALFFAQLGVGTERLQDDLFQTYVSARGWLVKKSDMDFLRKATKKWAAKRWQRYERKIQRNSSAFLSLRTANSVGMFDSAYQGVEFMNFIRHPDSVFRQEDIEILKAGRSSTVIKIKLDNRYYVVKRYNIKNIWHRLRRCLRTTRALCSWKLAQRLKLFGIPTAAPVAFVEKRFLGFRGKSYFVTEFVEGIHSGDYFADYHGEDRQYAIMAERIVGLFINLAKIHLIHDDLKMTNILIENKSRPLLIDLDGMREYHSVFKLMHSFDKEWQRFMQNWKTRPDVYALFENVMAQM